MLEPNQSAPVDHDRYCRRIGAIIVIMTMLMYLFFTYVSLVQAATNTSSSSKHSVARLTLNITKSTAVVTQDSGYTTSIELCANKTQPALGKGTLTLALNTHYSFASRTDMQKWAQGESHIPTLQVLGTNEIDALAPGMCVIRTFNITKDNPELASFTQWGPKPLTISYQSADGSYGTKINTFLTRSNSGLNIATTPPMRLTAIVPLLAKGGEWEPAKQQAPTQEKTDQTTADKSSKNSADNNTKPQADKQRPTVDIQQQYHYRLSKSGSQRINKLADIAGKHHALQTIAEPNTLKAAHLLYQPSAWMQPHGFDMSAYADEHDDKRYVQAGISQNAWSEHTLKHLVSQTNGTKAIQPLIAWQTNGAWSQQALNSARHNGYQTVIATHNFMPNANNFAVQTGVYHAHTSQGTVTVLAAQSTLSLLANEHASSNKALGERTQAGRINRLIAQSAFYQMEQPYVNRHLLIAFRNTTSANSIEAVMNALEHASWLDLKDLRTLSKADVPDYPENQNITIASTSGISQSQAKQRQQQLTDLTRNYRIVQQFANAIVAPLTASNQQHETKKNAQLLAKQKANSKTPPMSSLTWSNMLQNYYGILALHEIAYQQHTHPLSAKFAHSLIQGITLNVPKSVTVVSETASMPVSVSNQHPYPVSVYLSSKTNAIEIVAARKLPITIPAESEIEVTLPLRVTTSSTAQAVMTLQDRNHHVFSHPQTTNISSTLRISDKSGSIIIIVAFLLGLLGLWRQCNRKKDANE